MMSMGRLSETGEGPREDTILPAKRWSIFSVN
jgi:hypothetical protein